MARNHGDFALPHSTFSNADETFRRKELTRDYPGSMPPGYSSGGGEMGSARYNKGRSVQTNRRRGRRFKPLKTMLPPVGLVPDLLVFQNMLIDLAKVTSFCALINAFIAWAYCVRYQLTFAQAWDEKTARQLSAMILIFDLLFIILVVRKGIEFSLSEGVSVARRASLSVLGAECKIPARPTKVRKSICPPDPCPFDEDKGYITSTDSEAERGRGGAIRDIGIHKSSLKDHVTAAAEDNLEKMRGNVHKDAHDTVVMKEMAQADLAMSSIPTGILIEEDNKQWEIQERMKKIINLENSREGIELSATEKDTLKRIMDARKVLLDKGPPPESYPYGSGQGIQRSPQQGSYPYGSGQGIERSPQPEGYPYSTGGQMSHPRSHDRDFHDVVGPEYTEEDTYDSTASDDTVKKRRKLRENAAIPTSYIIFTISMLMLSSIVAAMIFIPDLDEWLRWLWDIISDLLRDLMLFLSTDVGKALLAALTFAVAGACLRGARPTSGKTIQYNAEGTERIQRKSDNLKDGLKESIKISYQETIPDEQWNQLRQ